MSSPETPPAVDVHELAPVARVANGHDVEPPLRPCRRCTKPFHGPPEQLHCGPACAASARAERARLDEFLRKKAITDAAQACR